MLPSSQTLTSLRAPSLLRYRLTLPPCSPSSYRIPRSAPPLPPLKVPGCSPGLQAVSMEPLESKREDSNLTQTKSNENDDDDEEEEEEEGISRIQVPRQRYIPVSKAELLDAIVVKLFDNSRDENANNFLLLSSCLDSILHAEHKSILEQMRADYYYNDSVKEQGKSRERDVPNVGIPNLNGTRSDSVEGVPNGGIPNLNGDGIAGNGSIDRYEEEREPENLPLRLNDFDLRNFLIPLARNSERYSDGKSRLAVATRFQCAFMQLLYNAQFEELSARDLMLTSALNTDYLLTLPIYVDWKRASQSNAIIFRRGYATERQKGLLIVEKLDFIQSKLLQGIFSIISKPLLKVGKWINEAFRDASQTQEAQGWIKRIKHRLKEPSVLQQSCFNNEQISDNLLGADQLSDSDLPIWLAAERAVSRYEGVLSTTGPRGRLFRKLLAWVGLITPTPETTFQLDSDSDASEPYLRPTFLSRISLSDIWKPASRKYCGNDLWKMLKTSVSILLSQSILLEPAFQELILLYTNKDVERDTEDDSEAQALQLNIYQRIPIPDLPVIFPHKKLSFRIIDTVRLDVASILGLSAFFINYKFEDILSSPSAIFLDVVAISALIIYITRVALGYKQTRDRYQLLVNKTLYEKTLASGFGTVHFLLDASEQQQYKEAILTYAILLKVENGQATCRQKVRDKCERFIYDAFKQKVEMPVDKALKTLVRLGLVTETLVDGRIRLQAIPCCKACEALKDRWNALLV